MSEWDDYAAGWDDDPGARAYATAAFSSLLSILEVMGISLSASRALDFGCGTGLLTERLVEHGCSVTAVDTSTEMLHVLDAKITARGWTNVHTTAEVPSSPSTFDLVVCSSVCSFLDDYPETTATLVDLLRPGGVFVQWDWELDEADDEPHGLARSEITAALTVAGLEHVLVDVGFEIPYEDQTMRPLMGWGRRPPLA